MPTTTRTFRVFVSSTFEDLRAERNILQEKVFPELERFCLEKGARFQAIDFRWGVREEAGLDQKTMEICLAEIARCQKTGIKPNFIVLLGNRYGWRPLPARIQQDEFESVLAHIANTGERDFVASWYDLDLNAVPSEYLLKPRRGIYGDWGEWEPVEQRIHRALREGARAAGLSPRSLIKYEASATHQEILKGLGETPEDRAHVFAFFRESGGDEDPDLTKLKDHLKAVLPGENVFRWSAGDHPRLCGDVERSLKKIIAATAAQFETQSEKVSHDRFAEDRAKHFKGREMVLDAIEQYLLGEDRRPLVVFGPSGSGKSAIMAVASEGKNAIRRFIGATPESSSGITLLRSLCRELGERFGQTGDLPATFNELSTMFAERLKLATVEQPVILFIDALDQLSPQDTAAAMRWLPAELPPYCHVVLSTTQIPEALRRAAMVIVKPLPVDDASRALDAWLTEASRTLQPEQREKLLANFLQSGLPLYLKLAFEEARLWRSFDPLGECVLGEGLPGIIDRLFARLSEPANHGRILVGFALGYLTAARYGLTEDEILSVLTKNDVVWKDVVGEGTRRRHDPPLRQIPVIVWSRLHLDLEPYFTERAVPGGTAVSFYHRQLAERVETTTGHHGALAAHFGGQSHWLGADVPNRRKLTELVRQQVGAGLEGNAAEVLTDLDFVSAKCAAELVFDLEEDYRVAMAALPEAQEELREEQRRQAELARWTRTLIECAEERRLPKPDELIKSVEPWSHERIAAESKRIAENPTRLDRLKAFDEFVARELSPLAEFGKRQGFVVQHAFNSAPKGPVQVGAAKQLEEVSTPLLLRRWLPNTPYSLKPALKRTLKGPMGRITSLSVTLDGRRALSGGDTTLRMWNLETGESTVLQGHAGAVRAVSMTPDGRRAVSGSDDQTLRVWNLETGKSTLLQGHTGAVTAVGMTPDGRRAVSGSDDQTLRVWNLETGESTVLRGPTNMVRRVSVAIAGLLRKLFDLSDRANAFLSLDVTPDGRRAVSGGEDKTVRVWNLETGESRVLRGHTNGIEAVSMTPDGQMAVSGSWDFAVRVWNLKTGESTLLQGHEGRLTSVNVTPDGRRAVSGSKDKTVRVWNVETGESTVLQGHKNGVDAVSMTPDGRSAVSGSWAGDATLRVWELITGESTLREEHTEAVRSVSVTPDGRRAVSGSLDKTLRVWNLETGASTALQGHKHWVYSVSMTPNGRRAVSGSWDKTLRVWNLETGTSAVLQGHTGWVKSVSMTPDGRRAVSGSWDKTLRVWNLETGESIVFQGHTSAVTAVSMTPDGRRAVSGSDDGTVRVWDLQTGESMVFQAHTREVIGLSMTPDGRRAVSASDDRTLRVWDLDSGTCLRSLLGHTGYVVSVGVTPDGRRAVSGGWDDTLRVWDLETGTCLAIALLKAECWAIAITRANRIVAGTSIGEVLFFDARGIALSQDTDV